MPTWSWDETPLPPVAPPSPPKSPRALPPSPRALRVMQSAVEVEESATPPPSTPRGGDDVEALPEIRLRPVVPLPVRSASVPGRRTPRAQPFEIESSSQVS